MVQVPPRPPSPPHAFALHRRTTVPLVAPVFALAAATSPLALGAFRLAAALTAAAFALSVALTAAAFTLAVATFTLLALATFALAAAAKTDARREKNVAE